MSSPEQHALDQYERQHASVSPVTGSRRVILGFAVIIAIGTLLLRLPLATTSTEPISWIDALFTSTSAVTVTGLTLFSTATNFSRFGQMVILMLLQVGGVGFIALSVVLFQIAGRQVGLRDRYLLQQTLGVDESTNILRLTGYVLLVVLAIELLGALLLFLRWMGTLPIDEAAYLAIFHSISAFCNAGFDLFSGTEGPIMFGYGRDAWTLGVLALLILIGGIGLPVVDDLLNWGPGCRLSLHTRLTLVITAVLTVGGSCVFLLNQQLTDGYMTPWPWYEQATVGIFTIISARTAGITVLPLEALGPATHLVLLVWMFIGGAPSSMAGGVSTSTVAALALAMRATVQGQPQTIVFGRALPNETIFKAIAVMTVSTLLVALATLVMTLWQAGDLVAVGFEVVSAFSNTGYSLGLTGELETAGKLIIALLMFWGRLGPLTLVVVLAQRMHPSRVTYPEEKVILG